MEMTVTVKTKSDAQEAVIALCKMYQITDYKIPAHQGNYGYMQAFENLGEAK